MGEIKYKLVEGSGKGKEFSVAATQTFHRLGGKFVKIVSGNLTLCATGDAVVAGWVDSQKDNAGKPSWTSSTTAGADTVFMIRGTSDNIFEIPVDEKNASLATSYIGRGVGLVMTGATKTKLQKAKLGATASPLSIVDVDVANKTVSVAVKPGSLQAN